VVILGYSYLDLVDADDGGLQRPCLLIGLVYYSHSNFRLVLLQLRLLITTLVSSNVS